jgi:disulfide bond formation protein DsbB
MRLACSIALAIVVLFGGYLALSIPAATDRTLDKAAILQTISSTTNVFELQNYSTAQVSVLCNYHNISARLLYASMATCFAVALLLLFAIFAAPGGKQNSE